MHSFGQRYIQIGRHIHKVINKVIYGLALWQEIKRTNKHQACFQEQHLSIRRGTFHSTSVILRPTKQMKTGNT